MDERKLKVKRLINIFKIICAICLIFSIFNIVNWKLENERTKKIKETINEVITVKNKESILDNYSVDFEKLKKINSEVVGYIKLENTNIDYTIVKHNDNSYYLSHSFDKKWNSAGWIFSHYKNKYDGTDKNYVIFGHARKDGSMFGTLKNVLSKKWQNTNSKIVFITENSKNIYEVFSVYKVKAEDYYIKTNFKNDREFEDFINKITLRSFKNFNISVTKSDRILTLSTCDSNNKYRVVLHAKEIKEN